MRNDDGVHQLVCRVCAWSDVRGAEGVPVAPPEERAPAEHRAGLRRGTDVRALLLAGRRHAVELDAQDTLGLFTRDGQPDRELFEQTVGAVVRRLAAAGRPLHAYGEMVALLWAQGAVRAALELEALWNGLQREVTFSLLCAYPGPHLRPPHRTRRLSGGNRTGTYASHPGG